MSVKMLSAVKIKELAFIQAKRLLRREVATRHQDRYVPS